MDFGKSWKGKRILGDGKTWRGFISGMILGILVGIAQMILSDPFSSSHFGFGNTYAEAVPLISVLVIGALLGDCLGAFIKRRLGIPVGGKAPVLDQYDFAIVAVISSLIFYSAWFIDYFISNDFWIGSIFLIILIPVLHRLFNIIGYKLGKKHVPW